MISAVEQRFYQGVVDRLDQEWIPDIYYTLVPGSEKATYEISKELLAVAQPYLGQVMNNLTRLSLQRAVDQVVYDRTMRREILIWVTLLGEPLFIERLHIYADTNYSYRIAPYTDRTKIMEEVLEKMHGNTETE